MSAISRSTMAAFVLAGLALVVTVIVMRDAAVAREAGTPGVVVVSALPVEAREVLDRIHAGGPFRYSRDGVVFGNRERLLPAQQHGYYHEYTVRTPGARDRGARRIVCGGEARSPAACWYTDDHYSSFRTIRE